LNDELWWERVILKEDIYKFDEPEGCVDDVLSNPQRATEEALAIVHLTKPNQLTSNHLGVNFMRCC